MPFDALRRATPAIAHHSSRIGTAFAVVLTVAWLVFATLVLVLRYAVLPHIDDYRTDIERMASRALGATVRIAEIDASWRGLRPTLSLRSLRIVDAEGGNALELPSVRATLSWDSLVVLQLRLASLEIDAPQLTIRRGPDGRWFVAGVELHKTTSSDNRVGEWLLAQNGIRIRRARIVWHDEGAPAADVAAASAPPEDLVLTDVDFALDRSGWRHRVALRATPPPTLAAPIDLRAVIDHPLFASRFAEPDDWRGELYADVASGDVVAWRTWLPLPATVDAGRGRARVWMRFNEAGTPAGAFARRLAERTGRAIPAALDRIAGVTADLALDDVAVRWGVTEYSALASIDGRIDASQSTTEQRFSATHMALQPRGGNLVPATDFRIERTVGAALADESGNASLGAIDIGVSIGLVPGPLVPPLIAEQFAALKPRGIMSRMALRWTGPIAMPDSFHIDAAFERLALAAQTPTADAVASASRDGVGPNGLPRKPRPPFGRPGFENLDVTMVASRSTGPGAAPAAVTELALKVHGNDATVTAPGLFDEPVLRLAHLDADVGIRASGDDVEVKVSRGSVDNPDLAGTVDLTFRHGPNSGGVARDAEGRPGRGWIDLDARLSRAEVNRVPRYLPNFIGEKVRGYLAKSLLSGKVTDASFRMHGALERTDLRALPGAVATPNPVAVPDALKAIRDAGPDRKGATDAGRGGAAADEPSFTALIKVRGASFLYGPAADPDSDAAAQAALPPVPWPAFDDLDADVIFDQARLTVLGHSARAYGFRLTDVKAELPALADPAHVLRVVGRGTGPLQDLVRFINNSPVSRWTKRFTETTQGSGSAKFALALDLPLSHPHDAEVAGSLQFADNELALNSTIPTLSRVAGRLDFTDRGIAIDALTARALGGPLRVDAATRDGIIELTARGTMDAAALRTGTADGTRDGAAATATDRAASYLSGSTDYGVAVRVRNRRAGDPATDATGRGGGPRAGAAKPDIVVESNLVGLAIALPAPFAKTAAESWPSRVEITRIASPTPDGADGEDVRVSVSDRLAAIVSRRPNAQGQLVIGRGTYGVGTATAAASVRADGPSEARVDLPSLDLDAWRDVVRQVAVPHAATAGAAAPTASFDKLLPERVSLKTPSLRAGGRDFTDVSIDAQRSSSGWQADVVADQVAGRLSYTDVSGRAPARNGVASAQSGRLVARLARLTIPQSEASASHVDDALTASRQTDFPAIDLVADRFELRGRSLGRLEVVAENVGEGNQREWKLEKLGLAMPEARFTASGVWGHAGGDENTRLDFDIEASDVGALMDRFGLTRTIKNGTARLTGNAAWSGGPSTIDFASMTGSLKLEADKGQFLKADPGIAKLLNVLSLQSIPRRLTLDFNDVFAEGFAFDTVRADASVDHGIAATDNFKMRGVQAAVLMSGSADLARETADIHVLVLPDINAGAASLGVALINPVVGLATFAAQYLFKDSISRALSFEYNVAGPWSKPEVTKIDRNGKATPVTPRAAASTSEAPEASNRAE